MTRETLSTAKLLAWSEDGSHIVVPVFGPQSYGSEHPEPVAHDPRVKGDPYPWERWGMRYRSSELALVKVQHDEANEPTLEEYAQASRAIQGLIPNGRNAARNQ